MPAPIRLLAISDGRVDDGTELDGWLAALAEAGVDAVQLREKHLDDRRLLALARRARFLLPPPVRLIVNRRVDVALAAGADGVHLPADGLPAAAVTERFGERLLVGCSTHRIEEVEAARRAGAHYVTFGPVYPTPSKERYGPPPGLAGLARAATVGLPVLALGGVSARRLDQVAAAGAAGAAGIRVFLEAEKLPGLVHRAREIWER